MGLFDIFKKKNNSVGEVNNNLEESNNNEVVDVVKENNNCESNSSEKKDTVNITVSGKYDFLNDIDDAVLYKGLSDDDIDAYSQEFKETLEIDLPEEVKEFLKATNGCVVNGKTFLSKLNDDVKEKLPRATRAVWDIVGFNDNYRENTDIEDYVILGKDSISYFVYDIERKKYCVLSDGTLDVMNEYNDFCTMVKEVVTGKIYS